MRSVGKSQKQANLQKGFSKSESKLRAVPGLTAGTFGMAGYQERRKRLYSSGKFAQFSQFWPLLTCSNQNDSKSMRSHRAVLCEDNQEPVEALGCGEHVIKSTLCQHASEKIDSDLET